MATIIVRKNKLPILDEIIEATVADAIAKTVYDVVAYADPNTPVDTGTLKNNKEIETTPTQGRVHWKAEYALYVHEGTRHMPAAPFASDAVEKAAPALEEAIRELEGRI